MDEKPKLLVDMLGVRFSLQADEDPVYLQSLVSYFEGHVKDALSYARLDKDMGELKPDAALKAAILAGILITDRLYKEKKWSYRMAQKISEMEKNLTQRQEIDLMEERESQEREAIKLSSPPVSEKEDSLLVQSLMDELESVLKES